MYTYRNKKTGATFRSSVICAGGDWEQVAAVKKAKPAKAAEPAKMTEVIEPEEAEVIDEDETPKKQKKARK